MAYGAQLARQRAPLHARVANVIHELSPERAGTDPVRIGVLADIQTSGVGPYEWMAVERLLAMERE